MCHVLCESILRLYEVLYLHIYRAFKEKAACAYVDTDSYIIRLRGVTNLYHELKKLSSVLEFSKVPVDCELYDNSRAFVGGLLRFESFYIRSYIGLRAKVYSILEEPPVCENHSVGTSCAHCKHIYRGIKKQKATHSRFLAVMNGMDDGKFSFECLKATANGFKIATNNKTLLSITDGNRYFINKIESRPFGFDACKELNLQ